MTCGSRLAIFVSRSYLSLCCCSPLVNFGDWLGPLWGYPEGTEYTVGGRLFAYTLRSENVNKTSGSLRHRLSGSGNNSMEARIERVDDSLFVLYEPDPPLTANLDIFFFHGAQFGDSSDEETYINTWKSSGPAGVLWPQVWLSAHYPLARIFAVSPELIGLLNRADKNKSLSAVEKLIYSRELAELDWSFGQLTRMNGWTVHSLGEECQSDYVYEWYKPTEGPVEMDLLFFHGLNLDKETGDAMHVSTWTSTEGSESHVWPKNLAFAGLP
ncbi:hypothetical protein R1flu_003764 [Riccia fluitans]|uniref:Uncharacterized protein n=1 Tax=Riccia fluitans TaxID=41844 RepID=A0ABD1YAX2_9MARC